MVEWSKKDIPCLEGKIAIVTGGTGGLGYETALALAQASATVILASRNETKGQKAIEDIKLVCPNAKVSFGKIDLCSLTSVKEFANHFNSKNQTLDILVNNGGLGQPQTREMTEDGFELFFGTNYLSHFALTAWLLPSLRKSTNPRIVNLSGLSTRLAKINFDDLQSEKNFHFITSAAQSKLGLMLFTLELQKRSDESAWGLCVVSAHPGVSRTDIFEKIDGIYGFFANQFVKRFFSQSAADGALSQLYAATSKNVQPGGYYGPQWYFETSGPVGPAFIPYVAKDSEAAKKLWDISVNLTGVTWP